MLLLTLRGTPTLYYGDEIGMRDVEIPPCLVRDPFERNVPGRGLGRDAERTPMQWSAAPHAGFTRAEPWLPVAADYREVNVETQRGDACSMLALYRRLIALRRSEPALETGSFVLARAPTEVLAYVRASLNGGPPTRFQVDTGSVGVIVGADEVPNIEPNAPPGSILYTSSGIELKGVWTTTTITFPTMSSR